MTNTNKVNAVEIEEAREVLRELFPQGSTAHTILRHVSASGMSRAISVVTTFADGDIRDVSYLIARAGIRKLHAHHKGLRANGTGMDMGFDLVYSMSMALYNDGYAISQRWV